MKTTQLYQQITDQIIAAIESGKANQCWRMPGTLPERRSIPCQRRIAQALPGSEYPDPVGDC